MGIGPQLDDAMARAWPPAITERIAGWTLRYTAGVTRRANSVLAVGAPADLAASIAAAEAFYARHAASPAFLISDASTPSDVGAALVERGYVEDAPTWILHRDVDSYSPPQARRTEWRIDSADLVTDEWFDSYWTVEGGRRGLAAVRVFRDVLLRPRLPTRFVTVADEGAVFAVGQVVVVGDIGCLQCLATVPSHRRLGAGAAVVDALEREAASLGAKVVFGAVMADNAASLGMFDRLGYEPSHQYRYLVR